MCLLAAFAVTAMLPADADAVTKTYTMGNGLVLQWDTAVSHAKEGDDGVYKMKITDATGWTFPRTVNCYTSEGHLRQLHPGNIGHGLHGL